MKKQVVFIAQAKGGVGKSFVTWFIAQNKKEQSAGFIDLDKSTRTSTRLKKIVGEKRVLELSILDGNHKLDREMFLNLLELISKTKTEEWFVDLGAPESDELKSFLTNEVPAEELKEILEEINVSLKIYVIIAGQDAFDASLGYYVDMQKLCENYIEVIPVKNEGTFGSIVAMEAGDKVFENLGIIPKKVGKLPAGNSANEIITVISSGLPENDLTLAGRRTMKKVLENVKEELL